MFNNLCFVIVSVGFLLRFAACSASVQQTIIKKPEQKPAIINRSNTDPKIEARAEYPRLRVTTNTNLYNIAIQEIADSIVNQFFDDVNTAAKVSPNIYKNKVSKITLRYDVEVLADKYFGFRLIAEYEDPALPKVRMEQKGFVFDWISGKKLALSDLIYVNDSSLQKLSYYCQQQIAENTALDETKINERKIAASTTPNSYNFSNFTLAQSSLRIHYEAVDIGQSVANDGVWLTIPLDSIKTIVLPELLTILAKPIE